MKIIDAPAALLSRSQESWFLDARTISGGTTFAGREQVVFSPVPVWRAKITPSVLESTQRSWLAFLATVRGRACGIRLKARNRYSTPPHARFGAPEPSEGSGVPFYGGASFSGGAGWALSPMGPETYAAVDAYATSVHISLMGLTNGFVDGDFIGIAGNLYIVTGYDEGPVEGTVSIRIEPPLRVDVDEGVALDFDPTIVMSFTDDLQGKFDRNAGNPIITSTIDLIELPELT